MGLGGMCCDLHPISLEEIHPALIFLLLCYCVGISQTTVVEVPLAHLAQNRILDVRSAEHYLSRFDFTKDTPRLTVICSQSLRKLRHASN